jgi:hypothetical protein
LYNVQGDRDTVIRKRNFSSTTRHLTRARHFKTAKCIALILKAVSRLEKLQANFKCRFLIVGAEEKKKKKKKKEKENGFK